MKRVVFVLICVFSFCALSAFAGNDLRKGSLWQEISSKDLRQISLDQSLPDAYRVFSLNQKSLQSLLRQAPEEFTTAAADAPLTLTIPMPDGTLARFRVEHSLVVEQGLADKYPELSQTYRGQGIDDPTATVRFDFLPSGFHAQIRGISGTILVDPYSKDETGSYITYFKRDAHSSESFSCDLKEDSIESILSSESSKFDADDYLSDAAPNVPSVTTAATMRTYRLALAATNEYAAAVGGNTVSGTLAAQVLIMNRVNGVYERDLDIHMNIIANNNLIVYAGDNTACGGVACTSANDPYTNSNGSTMLGQNTTNLNSVIGTANYDIGHVFSTGGGGVAVLRGPCGANKARGVTGLTNPVGDAFAIDYVAHEMGHQFGANHTFNGGTGNCGGGNINLPTGMEVGSGITIMAYAGICGNQDLSLHSIDTFHVVSLEEILAYSQTGNGNTCAVQTATGNTAPTVSVVGGPSFNIPKQTPFALTATASDINNDAFTYDWQEYDVPAASAAGAVPNTDSDGIVRPIFRPYAPTTGGTRYFPSLSYILNNNNVPPAAYDCGRTTNCLIGELMPAIARTMTFQVVARDNRSGGGGISTATASVMVDANSGPFAVTAPNTNVSWGEGSTQTVIWDVANTTAAPVSAANVNIKLSTDGGQTFPTTLAANTPNDGSQTITIPSSTATGTARIRVESATGIFFDISDANFTILPTTAAGVSVSGRALTANGTGVSRARVSITDQQGAVVSVLTNSFGYYRFSNIPAGQNYVFSISDKRYKFNNSFISLNDNIADYNFTALP